MVSMTMGRTRLLAALALSLLTTTAFAQTQTLTKDDYARAERQLGYHTGMLVDHAIDPVTWIDEGQLWYRDHDAKGDRYLRLDVASGKTAPAFDQARLAKALSKATDKPVKAEKLGVTGFEIAADGRHDFTVGRKHYLCDLDGRGSCVAKDAKKSDKDAAGSEPGVLSPDKKSEAFIRDWNLWLRDVASGKETQLTTDGVKDYGYATDNAGWKHTDEAILVWSPDSTKIATFQQDQRKTGEMTLVSTNVGHPKVDTWKYPLVGDKDVTMIERVIIDVPTRQLVRLKMPPDQHRSTQCDDISCFGGWEDVQWAPDGKTLAFASTSRDHKHTWLRVADPETGAVREVFDEKVKTWFESGINAINWRYLPDSNAVLWWSQRSNWGHLYLYDLATGKLKHAITEGEWNVADVVRVDEKTGTIWFLGTGREAGRDPYYKHLYKVGFDGEGLTLLTPEDADHKITLSPEGGHFVDTYSTTTEPPVTVLRDSADGKVVREIARADISRLKAAGWVAPEKFTVKGRDGKTDIYGMMFKPSNFDPSKKYPIINYVYPGPQVGSIRTRSFAAAHGDNQALAELGFIVVAMDGMGTPYRSKAFHDGYYANIIDNTLPDQVAGMKALAKRHPWIDLERAGIWGHSGGGNATATAMFKYPDFFKVGIAESGNHDNRNYEDDWAEKWQGLLVKGKDGKDNYEAHANQNYAEGLKGKLLLAHGNMDDNVPPYQTWLVVDALIKANKDFDLLIFPNARHGYGEDSLYMTRRRWDYFVRHLLGAEPPAQYELTMPKP
ncbi:dipeptidyl aminopeptidase/acylaminoacyl peptidase [Luteimonas cucumeris]|uniref:Dipeptidyl aminopeptidase/acylaminoacyl peptidase n=1 Tax=Luteimonas cucumeris TaxID=985012 RepID=A0A562KXQ4_9GAMM|nr:S9 family peptidase [Luteimonas cucumeris]TWH99973.1 dipeptidyl aminopeptidase/acylaminoacyl peptidase [Luteimonas cucumeris]